MAQQQIAAWNFDLHLPARLVALVSFAITLAILTIAPMAQAQVLSVLHTFTGNGDGAVPVAGLTMDHAGNFYGTTSIGGAAYGTAGYGTVFELSRAGTGWILRTIYTFQGGDDGANPYAGVVFGPDGALYGTTSDSGDPEDYGGAKRYETCGTCGTVFRLVPPSHACQSFSCPWTKTVLYHFTGSGGDGANPGYGDLTFDAAGNIYGTTMDGGGDGGNCDPYDNCGVVFKLTRSGGSWTESVLYSFSQSGNAGFIPESGVVVDSAGNVYGTTFLGGANNAGAAYQLTPSGSSYRLTVLHGFGGSNDGAFPFGGMIMDRQGNLYGTTGTGPGSNDGGTVFEFQPSGDSWTYSTLAVLPSNTAPEDTPIMDAAGNLYATGVGGVVFKLTHSGGVWTYNLLYDLNGEPTGGVVMDANGNLYGTTEDTFASAWGEVWELTP
jgi:hypothetical protein